MEDLEPSSELFELLFVGLWSSTFKEKLLSSSWEVIWAFLWSRGDVGRCTILGSAQLH